MAEGTYEYECMRAELLGLEQPDYDEFMKSKLEKEATAAAEEEIDTQHLQVNATYEESLFEESDTKKEATLGEENLKNIHGGLDELNSILQNTQKKINRFRQSCGSLTNLLKFRIGSTTGSTESMVAQQQESVESQDPPPATSIATPEKKSPSSSNHGSENGGVSERKSDLARALDKHVDNLDSLYDKMENAQYSMSHQNKQMKKFLN